MRPTVEEYVFYRGEKLQVEFYFTDEGKMPAKEFLEGIPGTKVVAKLMGYVKSIVEQGALYDERKFRLVGKKQKIYEFKPTAFRFFGFFSAGGKLIITNGYMKKSQKVKNDELERAIRCKNDYFYRLERGMYYEKR